MQENIGQDRTHLKNLGIIKIAKTFYRTFGKMNSIDFGDLTGGTINFNGGILETLYRELALHCFAKVNTVVSNHNKKQTSLTTIMYETC